MHYTTLVSTDVLAQHLGDSDWVVFDCRFTLMAPGAGQRAYHKAHIPGARYAHLDNDLSSPVSHGSGRHPLPDPKILAEKLGNWGVSNNSQVVVYDDAFGAMAGRMWWLLKWLGHDNVALLDGVYPKWLREKRPVTHDRPQFKPSTFNFNLQNSLWVDANKVEQGLDNKSILLMDARSEERFTGEVEPIDKVAGHIPGAINIPFEDNLDIGGDFLSVEELGAEYKKIIGDRPLEQVVHMCGSGVTACHNLLAMEHAGLHGAKLFAGSWSEWIEDESRPTTTGD